MKTMSLTSIVLVSLLSLTACKNEKEVAVEGVVLSGVTQEMMDEAEVWKKKEYCAEAAFFGWETKEGECPEPTDNK